MSLLALPNELLQQIACSLSCSDLLHLSRVNHQVRNACYDPLVFKDVAQNALYNTSGAVDRLLDLYKQRDCVGLRLEQLSWPEGELLLDKSPFEDKIRIGHAIGRLLCLSMVTPESLSHRQFLRTLTLTTSGLAEWLPHLLALHHPAAWLLEPNMFMLSHGQLSQSNASSTSSVLMNRWLSRTADQAHDRSTSTRLLTNHFISFSFVLNYIILQQLASFNRSHDVLPNLIRHFVPSLYGAQTWVDTQSMTKIVIERLSERVPGYATFTRGFTLPQASAALLPLMVAIASSYDGREERILPVPAKISFTSFMDIPSLYHNSVGIFTTCHYKRMTTLEFLSGCWAGYYSDQRTRDWATHIEAPMRNIQIVARKPTEEERMRLKISVIIDRESRGYDSLGDFMLSGRVHEDGLVSVVKQYLRNGFSCTWTGRLMPFGIVGVWGNRGFEGYFWIFKEIWT